MRCKEAGDCGDIGADRAFHIDGAASDQLCSADLGCEGINAPCIRIADRNDIGMSGET